MNFKKWVERIQTADYNGALTVNVIEMTSVPIKLLEKTCSLKWPGKQEIQWDLMRPDQAFYTIAQEHCPKVFAEMTTTAI